MEVGRVGNTKQSAGAEEEQKDGSELRGGKNLRQ
jgi:hypothetical protein